MQPGQARTSGLGVPPPLLARWVGWVAPVRPSQWVLVLSCPSAALRVLVCAVSWATWLLLTGVPASCVVLPVRCPGPLGSSCARWVCCFAFAVSWATWLLLTGVPARCVVLLVRCPGPLDSCSPVCPLGALLCVRGVLGHLVLVHRCARVICCVACAVFWATLLLLTSVPAQCVVLFVRCPGPLGSCSPVCLLGGLLCVCGVLGHLAPVHRCACWVCRFACAVSWATWLLSTGVAAHRVGCVCGVLGHLAPVHRCARVVCFVSCAVSWATWPLFTGVPVRCVALHVRCPGPLGSCSPMCPRGLLCYVCGVVGHLAPVQRCARWVRCVACAVSWASWLLFTGVPAWCVALRVQCPGPIGSCSPVCPLGALLCVCDVLGRVAPVHPCAPSVRCFTCAVSWATWLLFTGVPARCVVLRVRCPGPLGSCSPVCPLRALLCVCVVLGHLAPVHRCARSSRCLCVRCPGPLGSCSPVCPLAALFCVCGVQDHLAPVHRCARSVCCAVGSLCGASLRGPHWSIWTAAIRSRQGLGTLPARTRPSGRRLFAAGRGLVPSGRTHVHPEGGWSVAGRGWVCCRVRTRPSGRRLVLLGTCPCAVVGCVLCALSGFAAPGGRCCLAPVRVPWLWPAACLSGVPRVPAWFAAPRPVRSFSVLLSAFPTLWCLSPPRGLAPLALLGGCAGHVEAGREPGSLCLPLAPAEAGALGSLRVIPVRGPAMGLSMAGPPGVRLGLRALRWLACLDPVTNASAFPYRPSFDGGLGRCTGAVS